MTTDIRRGWTSASNAAQDLACPGRHRAQQGMTDKKDDDAISGQAIHDALKAGDSTKLSVAQRDVYDSCKMIETKLVAAFFGPQFLAEKTPVVAFRENRYWCKIKASNGNMGAAAVLEHSGQADVVYRYATKALVIDYKTLQGDVADSPKNLQLRDLAVLVRGHFVTVDEVATAIIQPLVTHDAEVCVYGIADLARAEQEMFARVAASNNPSAPRKAGELQCKFCLAKTKCAAYIGWAGQMIPTGSVEPVVKELIFQTAMEAWTPHQRAIAAGLIAPATKVLEEMKEFLKDGLKLDPNFIPGWGLTDGSKRETIIDPQEAFNRFAALGGQLNQFMECVSVGKTKLKEALAGITGDKGRMLDAKLSKIMDGITDVSVTQPSLKKVEK